VGSPSCKSDLKPRDSSSGWMSSRCRFSTTWASIDSASVSLTTRTGTVSSSASFAALRRRAPATTSYLLSSSSRTRRGARIPCALMLPASSSRFFSSNRLRGLVADSTNTGMGTLRYSLLVALFCASCMTILLFILLSSVFVGVWPSHVRMTTCTVVLELGFCVGLSGNRRWLGGDAPENHSSGLLDGFQTLAEKISVSMPKLDVVGRSGSGLKPDCLADYEGHSLGLGFADLLGCQGATVAPVQHLVGDLVR